MPFLRARLAILLLLLVAAAAATAYWIRLGVPVEMAAAPSGRIACVSYAPYRKAGESPFTPGYRVSDQRIDEDLKALSRRFDCVRTYSVGQGLDQVPAIARRYGMKVLLGTWLSRDPVENAAELALAIEVANRERDVIRAIVVGNEVLLRGELPQRAIVEYLRTVRAATGLPVTYADVWEFWLKYREVAPAVDFITIHILPYWEDEPVAIDGAVAHVAAIYRKMQAAFPGREFLIGETGWPSEGRERWAAVPSRVNEARFFREFMTFVGKTKLPYNVIEAFDQPWKRKLEGTVGGYWGLYDDDLRDKFPLAGPVTEDARWWLGLVAGGAGAAGFVLFGVLSGTSGVAAISPIVSRADAMRALAGFFIGAVAAAEVRHFVFANRDALEWALTIVMTVIAVVTAAFIIEQVVRWFDSSFPRKRESSVVEVAGSPPSRGRRDGKSPVCASLVDALTRRKTPGAFAGALQGFWLVAATVVNLLLVFDGRYRDFPSLLFATVVVAYAALALTRLAATPNPLSGAPREIEERILAAGLVAGAAAIVFMELPINTSADLWALLCVMLAASAWVNSRPDADVRSTSPAPAQAPACPP